MKKIILIVLNLSFIIYGANSQESTKSKVTESEKGKLTFGFNMGVGQNTNGYRLSSDSYGFDYYEGGIHFTSGINASVFVTDRLRPRLEFRYSEMKYGQYWSDTYPDFDKTTVKLNTLNLNLNLDILALSLNKFQLFVSPGIVTEFNINYTCRNYLIDGADGDTNMKNYNIITDDLQYPSSIAGANISLIAKYKIDEHLGFVLIPGYNYYFKEFVSSNDKKYTRQLLNFGVEYTF